MCHGESGRKRERELFYMQRRKNKDGELSKCAVSLENCGIGVASRLWCGAEPECGGALENFCICPAARKQECAVYWLWGGGKEGEIRYPRMFEEEL